MRQLTQKNQLISLALYACSLILLLEWIHPLDQVTDTGHLSALVLYIVLCFILSASFLPMWVVSPLKLLGLLFVLNQLFYTAPFFSKAWFKEFAADLQVNVLAVFSQQWFELTPSFRTLLFLILIWMMSYLLYYWFAVRKKPFTFIMFTFIYLTVLDTFTEFDATSAIIRAFIIGVAVLGVSHLQHTLEKERLPLPSMPTLLKWIGPLLIVIGFSTVIGYAAPKFDPIWPDPVPFLQSAAQNGIGDGPGGGIQKIGYGSNDERLGGGFIQDDTVVFYASAPTSQYWKVETKDTYTGKGWVRSQKDNYITSDGSLAYLQEYTPAVELREDDAYVQFEDPGLLDKLVYTYGTEEVIPSEEGLKFAYSHITGEVFTSQGGDNNLPSEYKIEMKRPFFPLDELRSFQGEVTDSRMERYLQLPESLPERVKNLAEEITAEHDTRYAKAKAIEDFFSLNNFTYDTRDVPVPGEGQDYVDQFLFETQRGYCDNFSTSMVVLLRSVDIPARWAKGFTGGERVYGENLFPGSKPEYEVQNNNAHSWVEVYFPNIGWVPFEPTIGFDNQSSFVSGQTIDEILAEERQQVQTPETPDMPEQPNLEEDDKETEDNSSVASSFSKPIKFLFTGLGALALGLIVWLIIKKRFHILRKWKSRKMSDLQDIDAFTDGYHFLLKVLDNKGLKLKEGQTLREYSKEVDAWFGQSDMSKLTRYYERMIYREESIEDQREIYLLWNRLVSFLLA